VLHENKKFFRANLREFFRAQKPILKVAHEPILLLLPFFGSKDYLHYVYSLLRSITLVVVVTTPTMIMKFTI